MMDHPHQELLQRVIGSLVLAVFAELDFLLHHLGLLIAKVCSDKNPAKIRKNTIL